MNGLSGFFSGFHGVYNGFIAFNNIARGKHNRIGGLVIVRIDKIALWLLRGKIIKLRMLTDGKNNMFGFKREFSWQAYVLKGYAISTNRHRRETVNN